MFQDFADEERGHKVKLEAIKSNKSLVPAIGKVVDLKIGDYLVEAEPNPNMDYQKALILAMQQEKAAFRLYSDLAASAGSEFKTIFLALAQEEAKHKLRFELEYDEHCLKDN